MRAVATIFVVFAVAPIAWWLVSAAISLANGNWETAIAAAPSLFGISLFIALSGLVVLLALRALEHRRKLD